MSPVGGFLEDQADLPSESGLAAGDQVVKAAGPD
jgi:hypothetical protein